MRHASLAAVVALVGLSGTLPLDANPQIDGDQIALVIPAVEKGSADLDDADASLMSYIVAQSIRQYFQRPPGVHRSIILTISAPLKDSSPASMATLARINGAQIAVVMKAFPQLDGTLINTVMVIPDRYQDFRTHPVEILYLDFDQQRIALDIPGRYVVFPSIL